MFMCTTACMQVGMAILCNQIDLSQLATHRQLSRSHHQQRRLQLEGVLNWCMDVASVVHGRLERRLWTSRGEAAESADRRMHHDQQQEAPHRMVSVNELITTLGINLHALGVGKEEYLVCSRGRTTRLILRNSSSSDSSNQIDQHATGQAFNAGFSQRSVSSDSRQGHRSCWLRYETDTCYISLNHLPLCMRVATGLNDASSSSSPYSQASTSVAMVTANGHTVCVCCYGDCNGYALFDPAPGRLCISLSDREMVDMLQSALRIPESAVNGDSLSIHTDEHESCNRRRKRTKAKGSHDLEGSSFYCDVTIFYMQG